MTFCKHYSVPFNKCIAPPALLENVAGSACLAFKMRAFIMASCSSYMTLHDTAVCKLVINYSS